jgi:hypothetical protein
MSVISVSTTATTLNIDTRSPQVVLLPLSRQKIGRVLTVTDYTGYSGYNPILISTQVTNLFDNGSNLYAISSPNKSITFFSKNSFTWGFTGAVIPTVYTSTLSYTNLAVYQDLLVQGNILLTGNISSPTISSLQNLIVNSNASFVSTLTGNSNYFSTGISQIVVNATGLAVAGYISSSLINTIVNNLQSNPTLNSITVLSLQSTLAGLGSLGYASTVALNQTSNYYKNTLQNWSSALSSVALYTSNTSNFFWNTSNYIKNYTLFDISTAILSTSKIGGSGGSTLSSLFLGAQSTQNAIRFWGKRGEYNTTVIAEQSTGSATGELVLFKGSTTSDQLRFQTTGRMLFESGVPSRTFETATALITPTMIITASCNVGIMTNNPIFTLDVGGTGRFQTLLSTPSLYTGSLTVGSLSMGIYFA